MEKQPYITYWSQRHVNVERLKELEGQTLKSFKALTREMGWTPACGGRMENFDKKRLMRYCQLEFSVKPRGVTIVKVY